MVTLTHKTDEYRALAEKFLSDNGHKLTDVKTGSDAWRVAHSSGICRDAYDSSRDITDAHIVTVLKRIMPNAEFRDKYRH